MRISDWSSDVCSTALRITAGRELEIDDLVDTRAARAVAVRHRRQRRAVTHHIDPRPFAERHAVGAGGGDFDRHQRGPARPGKRRHEERKSGVAGKRDVVRVDLGWWRINKKKMNI